MKNVLLVLITLILVSCSSSNDVVRSGFLQKRKYKKGYNLSFKKKEASGKNNKTLIAQKQEYKNDTIINKFTDLQSENLLSEIEQKDELLASIDVIEIEADSYSKVVQSLNDKIEVGEKINNVISDYDTPKKEALSLAKIALVPLMLSGIALVLGLLLEAVYIGGEYLFYLAGIGLATSIILLIIALLLYLIPSWSKKRKEMIEGESTEKANERSTKKEKKAKMLSNLFTWLTALFPFFIIPAIIFNFRVIKNSKESGNKKTKNKAIWRLIALPFLVIIGLSIFLSILEGVGILTSSAG